MQAVLLPAVPLQHSQQAGVHPPAFHVRGGAGGRGQAQAGAAGEGRVAVQRSGEELT